MSENNSSIMSAASSPRGNALFRILICDDDALQLGKIAEEVTAVFETEGLKSKIHTFTDADAISSQILFSCDIALLDVDFAGQKNNGLDIARQIRTLRKDTIIIFITNFIEYAPAGYEVQAFRYVLKRELESELEPYLHQAIAQLQSFREVVKVQVNGEIIDLPVEDILYLEVQQHNITVYVQKDSGGKHVKAYHIYGSLSSMEQQLEELGFLRIHKSFLVNMRHLSKFQCREAALDNGTTLRVGEKSYAEKKRQYLLWKGWH